MSLFNLFSASELHFSISFWTGTHGARGPGTAVGIATAYGLDGPAMRIPVGARFSTPVQTGPEAHTASCTMGTRSFPGIRCGRSVTLTIHPLLVPRSKIE
jgi:hypothetical protein